jgi:Rps23 Pro-64 3,4-dihydroxylase Tpa1-like proline 4-hydroxylase
MLINPEILPLSYRDKFIQDGSVVIRNFLLEDYVENLHNFFNLGMPENWWYSVSYPGTTGNVRYIRNFEENKSEIDFEKNHSIKLFNEGLYTYHFYRSAGDHYELCNCEECNFRKWLRSDEILKFLNEVSGFEVKEFSTMFASRYSDGCFLSPHHDDTLGSIGFVLQLTKNWKPQWGGILHFLDDNRQIIEYSEVPTFNTLTLFHIPQGKGKWHYVSHVNPGITSHRIAYSGWYKS